MGILSSISPTPIGTPSNPVPKMTCPEGSYPFTTKSFPTGTTVGSPDSMREQFPNQTLYEYEANGHITLATNPQYERTECRQLFEGLDLFMGNGYGLSDGYGEGYGYYQAPPPPPPQPKSQADCPSGTKFKFRENRVIDGYGNIKQIAYCGEPESQADCPDGTTFIQGRSSDGMQMVYTPSKCKKNNNCEQKYIEYLAYIKKYGPQIRMIQKTKEEFMAECNGTTIPTPVNPVEKVVEAIKPKTEEQEYRNFIYLAMAGIGVYLLLSE